jgi:hypothetical protein
MEDLGESRLTLDTTGDHTTLVHSTPLIKSRPSVDSSLVRGGVLEVWRRRPVSSNMGVLEIRTFRATPSAHCAFVM